MLNDNSSNDHRSQENSVLGKYLVPGQKLSPESLAEYYNENVRQAQAQYDANDWADPAQIFGQFEFLIEHADLNGKTLLDVGSGNGCSMDSLRSVRFIRKVSPLSTLPRGRSMWSDSNTHMSKR
jgi:hypothetical protein